MPYDTKEEATTKWNEWAISETFFEFARIIRAMSEEASVYTLDHIADTLGMEPRQLWEFINKAEEVVESAEK